MKTLFFRKDSMSQLVDKQKEILTNYLVQNNPSILIEQDDFFSSLVLNYKEKFVSKVGTPTPTPNERVLKLIDNFSTVEAVRTL